MAFTYGGDPGADTKDEIRFLVGDIGPSVFILSDEEYVYLLTQYTNPLSAAAAAADAICAQFAKQIDEATGDLARKCSQKSKAFSALADKLRKQASDPLTSSPVPFAGGTSFADIESREDDLDRFPDIFNIGETDSRRGLGIQTQADLRNTGRFFDS